MSCFLALMTAKQRPKKAESKALQMEMHAELAPERQHEKWGSKAASVQRKCHFQVSLNFGPLN